MCPQLICIIGFGRLKARHATYEGIENQPHRAQSVTYVALQEFNTEKVDNILNLNQYKLKKSYKKNPKTNASLKFV